MIPRESGEFALIKDKNKELFFIFKLKSKFYLKKNSQNLMSGFLMNTFDFMELNDYLK